MNAPIHILLADAAFLVRQGIRAVISGFPHMKVIGEAAHSNELRRQLKASRPDLVIIDYNAPGAFSLTDVAYITEKRPEVNVLVISSNLQKEQVLKVLEFGTRGFLLKACDQTEIIGAIEAVARKEKFFCGKVLDIILERSMNPYARDLDEACEPTQLTNRETEIVKLMAEGHSAQEIARRLSLSVHTIYTHRKNIMRKLGVTTAAEVILYAINTSLIQES